MPLSRVMAWPSWRPRRDIILLEKLSLVYDNTIPTAFWNCHKFFIYYDIAWISTRSVKDPPRPLVFFPRRVWPQWPSLEQWRNWGLIKSVSCIYYMGQFYSLEVEYVHYCELAKCLVKKSTEDSLSVLFHKWKRELTLYLHGTVLYAFVVLWDVKSCLKLCMVDVKNISGIKRLWLTDRKLCF